MESDRSPESLSSMHRMLEYLDIPEANTTAKTGPQHKANDLKMMKKTVLDSGPDNSKTESAEATGNDEKVFIPLQAPPEIRNLIYKSMHSEGMVFINDRPERTIPSPALSQLCSSLRTEYNSVFYGDNRFVLDLSRLARSTTNSPQNIFRRWLACLGEANVARLRHLRFSYDEFWVEIDLSRNVEPPFRVSHRVRSTLEGFEDHQEYMNTVYRSRGTVGLLLEALRCATFARRRHDLLIALRRTTYILGFSFSTLEEELQTRCLSSSDLMLICYAVIRMHCLVS